MLLNKIQQPECLQWKPSQVYEQIKMVAKYRYRYELPKKVNAIKILDSKNNKMSFIRDLSLKIGVSLFKYQDREYILDNDINVLKNKV